MNICLHAKFKVWWCYGFGSIALQQDEKTCFPVFHRCYVEINLFLVNLFFFWYVLDIDVTRNRNTLKLKVKSEFSLSMGLILINHSNPTVLPYCVIPAQ